MKKKLALLLAALLLMAALAGCTSAELGYLELQRRASIMAEGEISGSAQVEVDMAALSRLYFEETLSGATEKEAQKTETQKKKLFLSWSGAYSMEDGVWEELNLQCGFEGKTWDLGSVSFDGVTGEVIISKQTLLGVMDIIQALDPEDSECYAYTKEYREALLEKLADCQYISVNLYGDMESAAVMKAMMGRMGGTDGVSARIMEKTLTFLQDAHKGYETGLVKKVGGVYQIKLTLGDMPGLINDYLTYIADHSEEYRTALNSYLHDYMEEVFSLTRDIISNAETTQELAAAGQEETAAVTEGDMMKEALDSFQISKDNFQKVTGYFGEIRGYLEETQKNKLFQQLKDSYYMVELSSPSSNVFSTKESIGLVADGRELISAFIETKCRAAEVTFAEHEAQITGGELESIFAALSEKFNPVQGAVLEWYDSYANANEEFSVWVDTDQESREPVWAYGSRRNMADCQEQNGRMYIKLADICSVLGLSPQWNANIEKAYVQKDGIDIYLDGYQKDQRTWIAVRELEKLGYKVSYHRNEWDGNVVEILREH